MTHRYIYIYILCNQIYSILALGICTDLVSQVDANIFKETTIGGFTFQTDVDPPTFKT